MYFTKTQVAILKIFCSRITESFSIKEISEKIKQNYSIVYSALQDLYKNRFLIKDKHKIFSLNYKENHSDLAYIESLRAEEFLKKHIDIALFIDEVIRKINLGFFNLLLFGSFVEGKQRKISDLDILIIIENSEDVEKIEKQVKNISEKYGNFDCNVISKESVKEMLIKKEKLNVINETLNKHVLFFGAENYYRLIST